MVSLTSLQPVERHPLLGRRNLVRTPCLSKVFFCVTPRAFFSRGLVVIERIFNYQGMGLLIFNAATRKDFPMLQSAVLVVGIIFIVLTLVADLLTSLLNPRIRVARAEG